MITERPIDSSLKTALVDNRPLKYAHLVKFERPSLPDDITGLTSTSYERYTYLTDASINVHFDDGSVDLDGNSNGEQIYLANKVLNVGQVIEQTKATAGTTNLVLDGNAIGAYIIEEAVISSVNSTTWDIDWTVFVNPAAAGFREGDKVELTYNSNTYAVNIQSFRAGNVVRVTKIDDTLATGTFVTEMAIASEEILSILLDKSGSEYASFINREVYIYRAYYDSADHSSLGDPFLLFKGIIQGVSFDDSESDIKVTWNLTSHWGDFTRVRGRLTSDAFHRALDENGVPQPLSALKPVYAYDKGFAHSENTINLLSTYIVQVEKQKVKSKKGFLGIGAKVKVKTYLEPEERHTDLDFQLKAKSLPVIYGVRSITGIPIFADTHKNNSAEVYIAFALCEGEIGGIYDVNIDGNSLICNDKADYDSRSSQTSDNTVELICRGRADAGDVLSASTEATAGTWNNWIDDYITNNGVNPIDLSGFGINITPYINYQTPGTFDDLDENSYSAAGVLHGEVIKLTDPQNVELEVFAGKTGQKASTILTDLAINNNFKIQTSYWDGGDTEEYWGPNHRLLDTAYVLAKVIIAEGEEAIPDLDFVVRGKAIKCYNYDYSYKHDVKSSSEDSDNFVLGDTVSLYQSGGSLIASNVQIIDKWTIQNPDGTENVRFKWSTDPDLGLDSNGYPTITKFYMSDGSNTWTMVTFNHTELTGTIPGNISSVVQNVLDNGSNLIRITFSSNSNMTVEGDPNEDSPIFSFVDPTTLDFLTDGGIVNELAITGTVSSTDLVTKYTYSRYHTPFSSPMVGSRMASRNTIRLPASASSTNEYYTGMLIEIEKYSGTTGRKTTQEAEIISYDGSTKIATIDSFWSFIPDSGHTLRIYQKYADTRISINPAIQLLDYVSSSQYGRGLNVETELDLPSWMETGRYCDDKSDVTIKSTTSPAVSVGDVYKYPSTGNIKWQGEIASVNGQYVTFTNVIGKLTNKFKNWRTWSIGDLVYNGDIVYTVTTGGVFTDSTTLASNSSTGNPSIVKVSGSGPASITMSGSNGNPIRALDADGAEISGYSLYDCDSIDYWRLSGWDEYSQHYATRFQTNLIMDTSNPIFENTNSLLDHFGGILRYTAGKYYLDVERQEPAIESSDIRNITQDEIVGRISLNDEGVRSSYNSLTAAFPDPGNKFEASNISFFNSDYLKIDRNVPKKGNLTLAGITNYYNTRMLADTYLNKSRFGLTANMTIRHHGILLLAGTVIEVTYSRYKWNNKPFRIQSVSYRPDGLTDIVAKEYDDSFYSLTRITRATASGATGLTRRLNSVGPPANLRVTSADTLDELYNGVELVWDNNEQSTSANVVTQVFGSRSPEIFLTVTDIVGGSVLQTSETDHGLLPGMIIYPTQAYLDELDPEVIYYVRETKANNVALADNEFSLSIDKKNIASPGSLPDLLSLTPDTGLNIILRTGILLATVPVPGNTYIDTLANEDTGRVEKYYWIRHKVTV